MIFVIDDDVDMAECVKKVAEAAGVGDVKIFRDGIEAMAAIDNGLPDLVFLDILLDGPDGFTFLNEMASYDDTARVPVVIMTSLDLDNMNLEDYGVVGKLNKSIMLPEDIKYYVERYEKRK